MATLRRTIVDHGELAMLSVDGLPKAFWKLAPASHVMSVTVQPFERALLVVDGNVDRILEPGAYALGKEDRTVAVVRVDTRERELAISGQEVMTLDKVSLRVNVAARYPIVDPVLSHVATTDLGAALYTEVQMVVRRLVAGRSVDALLAERMSAANEMLGELAERVRAWGAQITAVDVKDVVLPGEMRALMNKVVEATKQAEASVILRREEVAATRSLANTAKMLAESPTLMRLKELEVPASVARAARAWAARWMFELVHLRRRSRGGRRGLDGRRVEEVDTNTSTPSTGPARPPSDGAIMNGLAGAEAGVAPSSRARPGTRPCWLIPIIRTERLGLTSPGIPGWNSPTTPRLRSPVRSKSTSPAPGEELRDPRDEAVEIVGRRRALAYAPAPSSRSSPACTRAAGRRSR